VSTQEVAQQFDQISLVYDETRDPLGPETLDALAKELRAAGIGSLLEVGVGTGRVAVPLRQLGFSVVGIDASRGMLARARGKGLDRLVRGSAYGLPFRPQSFDAALFVHVLHVLDEPERALEQAARVSRRGILALVHPDRGREPDAEGPESVRLLLRRAVEAQGFAVSRSGGPPQRKERELLARHPPSRLVRLSEKLVEERLSDRLDRLARRGNRHLLHVPPEVMARAVEQVRGEVGDRRVSYRRVEALALWPAA
jgi:SAM-dependent methyltransferase